MYAEIAVKTKIPSVGKTYTYGIPEELCSIASPGKLVTIPFGKKVLDGIILNVTGTKPSF